MSPYPLPSGERALFATTLLHRADCVVTNQRIIVMSPGEFQQVPLNDVTRVSAHVESHLPWVSWARFFPVRVYRAHTELILECTSREDMRALAAAIERGALLIDDQSSAAARAAAEAPRRYGPDAAISVT